MEKLGISYLKNFHFERSEKEDFSLRFDFTISVWIFNFLPNSLLSSEELLNFQALDSREKVSLLTKEQKTGKWLGHRTFSVSAF